MNHRIARWICIINGVLYFQINQYCDAIIHKPLPLWFDLGPHCESCSNQISDAIDAYTRVAENGPEYFYRPMSFC